MSPTAAKQSNRLKYCSANILTISHVREIMYFPCTLKSGLTSEIALEQGKLGLKCTVTEGPCPLEHLPLQQSRTQIKASVHASCILTMYCTFKQHIHSTLYTILTSSSLTIALIDR